VSAGESFSLSEDICCSIGEARRLHGTSRMIVSGLTRTLRDPAGRHVLNCANVSPQLRRVTEAGIAAVRAKASPWTLRASD